MNDIYEVWETADSLDALPDIPPFADFQPCYQDIDVGYDAFFDDAFVWGPYAIIHDEEKYGRDLWGWSAQVSCIENGRYTYKMPAHKLNTAEEAYWALCDWKAKL